VEDYRAAIENLSLDQLTKNLRALRESGMWKSLKPSERNALRKEYKAAFDFLSRRDEAKTKIEGLSAIEQEDAENARLAQELRREGSTIGNITRDLLRGVATTPASAARVGGFALDRLGAKETGLNLTEYAQNVEDTANVLYPAPLPDAGMVEKIGSAAAENLVPMLATGLGTKTALQGIGRLTQAPRALKATEIVGTGVGMSTPEILRESTKLNEYGIPRLPENTTPIIAGALTHGAIETGLGFSPASLVTKGKLTGLFAKDTIKRIAAFNKRYGPAKTAAIVAKRLFKDTPLGDSPGEGLEEVLQSPVTILTKNLANNNVEAALNNSIQEMANLGYLKELGEEFVIGAGVGALYGGARTTIDKIDNAIESKKTSLREKQELARRKEAILISEEEMNRAKEAEIRQNMAGQISGNFADLKNREADVMPESQAPWKPTTESDYRGAGISLSDKAERKRNDVLLYPKQEGSLSYPSRFPSEHVPPAGAVEKRLTPETLLPPYKGQKLLEYGNVIYTPPFEDGRYVSGDERSLKALKNTETSSKGYKALLRDSEGRRVAREGTKSLTIGGKRSIKTGAMEANKPVKELESKPVEQAKGAIGKLSERINQFIEELKGKNLTPEQQGIYDVFTRKEKIYKIQDLKEVGEYVNIEGGRRGYGAQHVMIKHYGTNIAAVTAEEILRIGEIIRSGKMTVDGKVRLYTATADDESELKVVVGPDNKNKQQTVITFHSKRKAPMRATRGTSALQGASQKAESSATSIIASTGQEVKSADALSDAELKNTAKIEDFGEKIGGARKDTAVRGFKKRKNENADKNIPAWKKQYSVSEIVAGNDKGKFVISDNKNSLPHSYRVRVFDTKEEAEKALPLMVVSLKHRVYSSRDKREEFSIYRKITNGFYPIKDSFKSEEEAKRYMAQHAEEIIETKIRNYGESDLALTTKPKRVGKDRKVNVTTKDFSDTFGFRGVEFGNWNNQKERQDLMDSSYAALQDLAELLGIPDKAISLNGELALAFGARGKGLSGARAHYELDYKVINLTKMKGAGALAHEWFHALDHYLARQDGKDAMLSEEKYGMADRKNKIRDELRAVYEKVFSVISEKVVKLDSEESIKRTKLIKERIARDTERYKKTVEGARAHLSEPARYGKKKDKATEEQLAKFDKLIEQAKDLEVKYVGYPKDLTSPNARYGTSVYGNDALFEISRLMKQVRGRNELGEWGWVRKLGQELHTLQTSEKLLKKDSEEVDKIKIIKTDFFEEARELDKHRAMAYWTRATELGARAFSAYVEDKLGSANRVNDFLSYGSKNSIYDVLFNGGKPFPEGAERTAINKAFDDLFSEFKTEKTESGIKLYSVEYLVAKYAAQGLKQAAKVVRRGAALIHSGVKEFAKWARQLFNEFGQNVKKYLVGLYKDVTTAYNRQKLHRRRGAIDLRPVGKTRQQIIELPVNLPDGLKTDSISAIRSWLKENFQGKSIFNKSLNAEIEFVAKGIKETVIQLAHRKNKEGKIEAHKHSLPILDKLLEQAIYENSTDDKNKGLKKDFADKIHYLSTNVRFEGEDYHIKFVVKQYGAKNNYHTHMLSNIEIKKESYAQKDGLRDYLTASAPLSDSFTSSIPKTETEVKPSEIDEIKAQAKADGTWLKAPNGKASKLNERQWLQVRTKAFKDWFGDWQNDLANASKVVDENGEPLVVYHGGSVGNEFSKEYAGSGGGRESAFFFTPDIRQAKDYAGANKVKEVFINLRTPLYTDIQLEYDETKKAKANGKDGYWIIEDGLIDESEIAVFEPTQIKSATANVGTFSKSDPNILYSVEYLVAKYTAQGLKQAAKVVRRGAALIHSGVKEFAKWARQLFNEFGQNVKKYLRGLYKDVTTAYNRQKLHSRRGAVDFRDTRSPKEMVKDKWAKKGLEKAYLFGDKLYNAGKTTFAEWQKYMQQRFKDIKEGELRDLWQNVKNPEAILKPKSLRDNNVPVSDKVFDMLGIKPDRVFADYSYLHQQHSEYFKSPAEVKKVAEYVLANPEISTQEVDGNAGLIRVSDGKVVEPVDIGYQTFKHPKIKLELEKRSNGYHVRSVHLLSDEQMIRDDKRRNSAPLDAKVTPNKLTEGVTTNKTAVLQAQVDARTSSTTSIPETDSKVKPADKKARLARPSDFKWEKIDKDTYMLQFTDPDNGEMSTVAKLARNKTGKGSHRWVWVGTNRAFLDAVSAKSSVKDKMFQKIKNSKYEQRKAARIAEREKLKQDKKKQEAQAYIDEGKKKAVEEELPKTYKDKVKHFIERAEEVLFDIWAPVKRLQKKIVEGLGKELPDDLNLYEKLELISGKIEEHVKKAKLDYLDKIKSILIENGVEVKDFDRFLYVSHAPERNDAVAELKNSPFALTGAPGSGISTEQANEELRKFEALPNYEGYKKAAELYYQLTNFLLDEQVRLGILSQKQREAYRRKYKKYTPLKSPPDQGFILERKALGRRSEASEQLAFTEQAIHAVYSRAFKKELASTAIKLFRKFPDSKMYERVKPKKVQILDKKGKIHIRQQMDKFFGNPEMIWAQDTETGDYTVYRIKDESLKRALITTFKENTVEKGFFRAFAKINRWLAATATAWNPEFIYTNLVRDVQLGAANVGINLPEGSVKEFLSNLARSKQAISDLKNGKVTEDTKLLNEFKLAGGKTGYSEFARLEDRASKLNKEVSDAIEGGNLYKIKQNMKSVKEFIETWNDAIETRTRFAGYLTAKEAGFSTQKAAAFAKNMTVNFNKKGSWAPVLNSLYLFSTANLGGTLVTVNLVKKAWGTKKGKAMIAAAITLGFLSEVLNSLVAGDDDEDGVNYYAKLPDYIKDANYVFMVPGGKGKYVAIPMPYGLNVLPSIGRNIAASMLGNQKASKGAVNIAGSLFDAFNPLGGDRRSLPYQVVPTAVRPLLDVATNTTWTGRKIRPEQDVFGSKVANAELYYEQNSKIIRNISKFFNEISGGNRYTSGFLDFPLTPGEIEHLLQSATGGIGKTITRVSDLAVKGKEEFSLDTVPVLRRFVNSSNDYTTYEAFRTNTEAVRDFERAKRERDIEWLKNNRWLMAAAEKFKQTQKITTAVNKSKLPEIKKRERILREKKNFNKYFDKLKSKVLSKY